MLAGLGRLVANKLFRFPCGTNLSSYTQLYVAFFLSALIHFSGDIMLEKQMVYHLFNFFLQAVAITFENFVIYLAKRSLCQNGIKFNLKKAHVSWGEVAARVIGYCWVTLWFCLMFPGWKDDLDAPNIS